MEIAVLLANMGGPDSLQAVEPFLREIFSDPNIIDVPVPSFIRRYGAKMIARKRKNESMGIYRKLGGKTPLHGIMELQAQNLSTILNEETSDNMRFWVYPANRYGRPSLSDVLKGMVHERFERIVVLSMYPFFATSTSGSIGRHLGQLSKETGIDPGKIVYIERYGEQRAFMRLLADQILRQLKPRWGGEEPINLLLSAHSIPLRHVRKGDPYANIVQDAVKTLRALLPGTIRLHLSFQSKIGPVKWLGPATDKRIEELAESGVRRLFVYPLGFVADNSETIYEIGMLYRDLAMQHGIQEFIRLDALNNRPEFIRFLAHLTLEKLKMVLAPTLGKPSASSVERKGENSHER